MSPVKSAEATPTTVKVTPFRAIVRPMASDDAPSRRVQNECSQYRNGRRVQSVVIRPQQPAPRGGHAEHREVLRRSRSRRRNVRSRCRCGARRISS